MSSIHESSLLYLLDLADSLEHAQLHNPLLKKLKTAKDCGKIDLRTVELAEKTIILIQQVQKEQQEVINPWLQQLCQSKGFEVKTAGELVQSIEERLSPLLEQAFGLKGKGVKGDTFARRIETVIQKLHEHPQPAAPAGYFRSAVNKGWQAAGAAVRKGAGVIAFAAGAKLEHEDPYLLNEYAKWRTELAAKTKSPVAGEFARVTSERVCEFLRDEVHGVEARDPIARPAFLRGNIFTEATTLEKKPELTFVGKLLSDLLAESPEQFQTVIEVNLLKATTNITDFLQQLQKDQPFFLVDLCRKCLEDVALQVRKEGLTPEDEQLEIMKKFSEKSTKLVFELAFPDGAEGLVLPSFFGVTNVNIPGNPWGKGGSVRTVLWELVSEVVQDQMDSFLGDIQGKHDLKNMALIEGYSNLLPIIASGPKVTTGASVNRLARMVPQAAGTLSLAPVGFVYIFLKLVLQSIVSVFQKSGIPKISKENAYPDQGSFDAHLFDLANSIIQDSDSKLLKFIAKYKLRDMVDQWGPVIVEAIREVKFIDIFNAQLENVVASVVSPGGTWVGEGDNKRYKMQPAQSPKSIDELQKKEEAELAQEQERANRVEELQQEFGKSIDGLLHHITESFKVEHKDFTPEERLQASQLQKIEKKIHQIWAAFANACMSRLIRLIAFVLNAKSQIKSLSKATHDKVKVLRHEDFVLNVGKFARKEFRDQIDSKT